MIDVEQLRIPVRVLEAKTAWGSTRFLVEPVHGSGSQWVTEGRLRFPAAVPAVSLGDGVEDAEIVG